MMDIVMTTLFGLEALTADECCGLGFSRDSIQVSDGQVRIHPDETAAGIQISQKNLALALARLNVFLRTAERVLVELASFPASDFNTLFDSVRGMPWETYLEPGVAFHVNGYSRKSALVSVPACQGLIKKAIVDRLVTARHLAPGSHVPENEEQGLIRIQFSIVADQVSILVDTSGESLHKRGYRPLLHGAPIRETLAAGMLIVSKYRPFGDEAIYDPFCGSGTLPIEAALMALNIAPGARRPFAGEGWHLIGPEPYKLAREEAEDGVDRQPHGRASIFGSDLSVQSVETSLANAKRAGVEGVTAFRQADINQMDLSAIAAWTGFDRHLVICNPPYGERLLDLQGARSLYRQLSRLFLEQGAARPGIRLSVISPDAEFEGIAGGMADKRRKLYNGMIKCTLYHYFRTRRLSH
jgi:putative N6-adenine-specific DNA methylase